MIKHFISEEEFKDSFFYPYKLSEFVESVSGNNRWWFKEAYRMDDGSFNIMYTSYITPEYRNFLLSIYAKRVGEDYEFSITKQVTDMA